MGREKIGFRVAGVDVAANRGLDVVVLDDRKRIVGGPWGRQSPQMLGQKLQEIRPLAVAIDAPPHFGLDGGSRLAERELNARGVHIFFTPSEPGRIASPFYAWMRVGMAAFAAASKAGYALYGGEGPVCQCALEVFPHASAVALKGTLPPLGNLRRRRGKYRWREASMDGIDAVLAALTALYAVDGRFCAVGRADEGFMVLPLSALPSRFCREAPEKPFTI